MANIVKYNLSTSPNSIQSGNFNIGVNNTATDLSQFYNGICPIKGGYTIYIDKASNGPSIYAPKNDGELIGITNELGGNVTTAEEALAWITSQSNMTVLNSNYPPIVTSGVSLNLDASFVSSYPTSGTTWYDLSGNDYSGSTTAGVSYDSRIPGSLVFSGGAYIENIGTTSSFSFIQNTCVFTIAALVRPTDYTVEGSLISNTRNFNEKGFSLGCGGTSAGILDFRIDNGSGYIIDQQISDFFTSNDWVFITIVGSGSGAGLGIEYYKNGIKLDGFDIGSDFATGNSARILTVGGANVLTNDWDGDISQVLIYNRAFSTIEVEQTYNAILNKFIPRDNLILSLDAQNTNLYATSATTAYDVSGNDYNGTLTNGVQYVANGNGSWNFDFVDDSILNIGDVSSFSFIQNTGIFTVYAWVRLTQFTTTQSMIMGNNRNTAADKGFLIGKGTSGNAIRVVLTNGSGANSLYTQQIANYFLNDNWVFVTIVGNGTNVIYYRNGTLFQTGSAIGTLSTGDSTRTLSVGRVNGTTLFWSGNISQTSIYDSALTETEISTIYNATKTRYGL
jgi:hypothetical protein